MYIWSDKHPLTLNPNINVMKNIIAALAFVSFLASASTSTLAKGGDDKDKKAKKSCCTKMAGKSGCSKDMAAKKSCSEGAKASTEKAS